MRFAHSDVILVFLFLILSPLLLKKPAVDSVKITISMFSFLLFYALISMVWVLNYDGGIEYVIYQLALAWVTILIPYLVSKITINKYINYPKVISNFSALLSVVFLFYIFTTEIGERLDGLLGGAAIIHVIMIPVLAVHWHNLMQRKRIIMSFICLFITMTSIFLTSSRAGLLSLILFILITLFRKLSIRRFIIITLISFVFVWVILQFAPTERYTMGFKDSFRSIGIASGISWATHSVVTLIFGNGFGSIWEWAAFDNYALPLWTFPLMSTEYGYVMFHAHSVFIQLFAELGLIGTIPIFVILFTLIKEWWRSNKSKNELRTNILGALICTIPSLHTDLFFFRNWEVSIIWLFFLFSAFYYPLKTKEKGDIKNNSQIQEVA